MEDDGLVSKIEHLVVLDFHHHPVAIGDERGREAQAFPQPYECLPLTPQNVLREMHRIAHRQFEWQRKFATGERLCRFA